MGRVGTPEDVASIVRYLAAEAHIFMTGQHFVVDGFQAAELSRAPSLGNGLARRAQSLPTASVMPSHRVSAMQL